MSLTSEDPQKIIRLNDHDHIQYLLGNPPSWMMRYGLTVMTGVFSILLILSYLIHYPDVVEAKVVLTTANPPIRVIANVGGRVSNLLVKDKEQVAKGQVLAIVESTAEWLDVLRLETWLNNTNGHAHALPDSLRLGELQGTYSAFVQHWKELGYYNLNNGVMERIVFLNQQIEGLREVGSNLRKQMMTMQEEYKLTTKLHQRQQKLFWDKVIAEKELDASEAQWLAQKRVLESTESSFLYNDMQIKQYQSQINDLEQEKSDNHNEKERILIEDVQRLHSAIDKWKQSFLISAPIAGMVSFSKIWSAQQSINLGEEILAIVPPSDGTSIIGKAVVPSINSGKIVIGQRVVVRLDGYPAQQYGILETTITGISLLPQKGEDAEQYSLDVVFPSQLITSYNKHITLRQEMTGRCRIITEDRRIIDRIFNNLRDLVQHSRGYDK